jgi:hypothetical protein
LYVLHCNKLTHQVISFLLQILMTSHESFKPQPSKFSSPSL